MVYPGVTAIGDLLDRDQMHQVSLRAEWGRSGNNDLRGYYYKSMYYPANYFGYGGVYLGNVANTDIRPEVTDTYDAGITAALFDGRRSEGRLVGKESVSTCRSRWSPDH